MSVESADENFERKRNEMKTMVGLEIFPSAQLTYQSCCGKEICNVCVDKCNEMNSICPLCRVPFPKTEAEVLARLQRRADKGDKIAQWAMGVAYGHGKYGLKKNEKRAVQYYEKSAALGHAEAQYNLGSCFRSGTGAKMDKKKALKYFTQSSEQGNAEAHNTCGIMHYQGEGVERDVEEALRYFELAAAQGFN